MVLVPLLSMFSGLGEAAIFPASLSVMLPVCLTALLLSGGWLPGDADIYFDALDWMSRQGVSPEDGAVVIQNALYAMHNSGEEADFLDEITSVFELDELPADAESIFETLIKHVPRWELDGVSAHELYLMQHPDLSGDSPF